MQIGEIMTHNPACCLPSDSAQKAAAIMRDLDTGVVPVVADETSNKLAGIVTDRDLCLAVIAEGKDPAEVRVEECMTTTVAYCKEEDDLERALELMRNKAIRRVPVVDDEERVTGILSTADVVLQTPVGVDEVSETLKEISEPSAEASLPRAEMKDNSYPGRSLPGGGAKWQTHSGQMPEVMLPISV
jgi:CBS domain-containing protein